MVNRMLSKRIGLYRIVLSAFLITTAHGLAQPANSVDNAIARVKSGDFNQADIDQIAPVASAQVIPILEAQFAQTLDAQRKVKTALALVRLHDWNDTYWIFLASDAISAINSDIPFPTEEGPQGKSQIAPAFTAWATAHNIAAGDAYEDAMFLEPAKVMVLAFTGDQRAIPLLRQALLSSNLTIQAAGALGLAQFQDIASIPMIISACQSAPAWGAPSIADALVYFDDPEAQAAAEKYVPPDLLKARRESVQAHGNKPFSQHP